MSINAEGNEKKKPLRENMSAFSWDQSLSFQPAELTLRSEVGIASHHIHTLLE